MFVGFFNISYAWYASLSEMSAIHYKSYFFAKQQHLDYW